MPAVFQECARQSARRCDWNDVHLAVAHSLSWRRQWHPTPVLLSGKCHGRRSLVGCSPWGRKELDTTEQLHFHFSLSCIGKGNGNPLQCSCLENPRDGGAWWAAIYGVTQSRTRLKWLSRAGAGAAAAAAAKGSGRMGWISEKLKTLGRIWDIQNMFEPNKIINF